MLGCAYTICLYGQIEISCTFPSGSPCRPSRVSPYTPSVLICCIRLLCDWSFHLCHHIAYIYCFVVSYYYYYYSLIYSNYCHYFCCYHSYSVLTDECIYSTPPSWAGGHTRSIFKQCKAGLNSEFSFSYSGYLTNTKEDNLTN